MKKCLCLKWKYLAVVFLLAYSAPLSAQIFEETAPVKTNPTATPAVREQRFNNSWANPRRPSVSSENDTKNQEKVVPTANQAAQKAVSDKENAQKAQNAKRDAAEALSKSLEGKRGYKSMRRVVARGEKQPADESLIFLFYKDFKISQTMGGLVMCDVKFIILTTLDNNVSNLSVRLKWPEIETTLSFNEIEPNVETYYNYTLVGDGCYSMDKIPNVIVNRCRVKGLSPVECANKIRWLKR